MTCGLGANSGGAKATRAEREKAMHAWHNSLSTIVQPENTDMLLCPRCGTHYIKVCTSKVSTFNGDNTHDSYVTLHIWCEACHGDANNKKPLFEYRFVNYKGNVVPEWQGWDEALFLPSAEACESPVEKQLHVALTALGIPFVNQHPVNRYRLDFAIVDKLIAIEVDGHDFHERTKEQAQRDKKRDRDLQALGWRVMRFTGSEVFRDAAACAREVQALAQR